MKGFSIFLFLMLFCISCKNFNSPPQVEVDDLTYYLSNSWKIVAFGNSFDSLEPMEPDENIKKGRINRVIHFNIMDENYATRFITYTEIENGERRDGSTSLDTLPIINGEIHSQGKEPGAVYTVLSIVKRKEDHVLVLFSSLDAGFREPLRYFMYQKTDRVKYEDVQ